MIDKNGLPPQEQIRMMERCVVDIERLQDQVKLLKPKAEAYDTIVMILNLLPHGNTFNADTDIVWFLRKHISAVAGVLVENKEEIKGTVGNEQ